jgi:ABC-type Fe3+-siderophore transport system permease subunit
VSHLLRFRRLELASFAHSLVYLALLVCAFVAGNPQPETFILGLTHGLMWIAMSLLCILAARRRIIPFWLAVTVAVLGGLGPFAGSLGFILAERHRDTDPAHSPAVTVD